VQQVGERRQCGSLDQSGAKLLVVRDVSVQVLAFDDSRHWCTKQFDEILPRCCRNRVEPGNASKDAQMVAFVGG
jgi:hypothetical protein